VLGACLQWFVHAMTVSQHGKTGGLNFPNCRQFNHFIETLLRFRYVCLIGPKVSYGARSPPLHRPQPCEDT